ncbi:MAG: carbon starvation protein A [Bacteroidales bacterium]|nr:carbon starvation protein A [Bacteroidales bacterium]HQP04818.1 carbon starvation protein A [Bacteroidales bacterium]
MVTFIGSIVALIAGYFLYGRFIDRFFGIEKNRVTPALELNDGVDYIPMPTWKIFVIQFLNIAGLGPIFGAILGAAFGPAAYIWIVLGCIFMGAVHDYFSGMLSIRHNGASLPELVSAYLGKGAKNFLRVFTLFLLIFVGVAFVSGPAGLLESLTGGGYQIWLFVIFVYYILATLLPIDKIIGKIYPFFGILLLVMAVLIGGVIIIKATNGSMPMTELSAAGMVNHHAQKTTTFIFPMMFIVISCGAISGFHATQSPMMARCLKNEKHGRIAFYGAMIAEGIVTIIWATAAMNYFGTATDLNTTLASHNPAWIVHEISVTWLGKFGAILAILGVIACPITTGDTAFRSARLTIADMFNFSQTSINKRLVVSVPLFALGFLLTFAFNKQFAVVWNFVGISNQILAAIVLWTAAMYLAMKRKFHWIISVPALFLSFVCFTYLLCAPFKTGGFNIPLQYSYPVALFLSVITGVAWSLKLRKNRSRLK